MTDSGNPSSSSDEDEWSEDEDETCCDFETTCERLQQNDTTMKTLLMDNFEEHEHFIGTLVKVLKHNTCLESLCLHNIPPYWADPLNSLTRILNQNCSITELELDCDNMNAYDTPEEVLREPENRDALCNFAKALGSIECNIKLFQFTGYGKEWTNIIIQKGLVPSISDKTNFSLEKLDLSRNAIGDEEVDVLSKILQGNKTLKKLILSGNQITSVGVQNLCTLLETNQQHTKVKLLDLTSNPIDFDGMFAIANLMETTENHGSTSNGKRKRECKPIANNNNNNNDSKIVVESDYCQITVGKPIVTKRISKALPVMDAMTKIFIKQKDIPVALWPHILAYWKKGKKLDGYTWMQNYFSQLDLVYFLVQSKPDLFNK